MCGIAGIVRDRRAAPVERADVERMTSTLRHRGPDGSGYYIEGQVGLGHRRLSIIDLAGGDQPIGNEDGSIQIVFNGEIYNYKELREGLVARGHAFKTSSDTEVIVHLYEELGPDCLRELNGMFAIALWDANRRTLLLARDRLGEKPLYYAERGGELAFGSELKAVLCAPDLEAELDLAALDDYLAYGYVPAPRTIYHGIAKLPAAHMGLWRNGRFEVKRYWSVADERLDVPRAPGEARARLRELLDDSVRIRLRSDVPVGAFLSGGIDSSLIVALAARESASPIQAFTVSFAEGDYDESAFAAAVAKHCGTEHRTIPVGEMDLSIVPELAAQFDEPFADPSAVPTYYVTREASRYVKVCLSGDGGDELFGGYERYRWEPGERLLDLAPAGVRRVGLGALSRALPDSIPGKGWLSRMASSGAARLQRKVGIFDAAERQVLFRRELVHSVRAEPWFLEQFYGAAAGSDREKRMATDRETYLPEDVLTKVDRDSMANSLEVRVPLLDPRVVAFADRLDLDLKIRRGEQKHILKQLLRDLVPPEIVNRGKRGFGIPLRRWIIDGKLDESLAQLRAADARTAEYLDRGAVARLIDAHRVGGRDMGSRIWALLWLELWLRSRASDRSAASSRAA